MSDGAQVRLDGCHKGLGICQSSLGNLAIHLSHFTIIVCLTPIKGQVKGA
jgi:hypothetical protein